MRDLLQSCSIRILFKLASSLSKKLVAFRTTASVLSATVFLKGGILAAGDRYGSGHVLSSANGFLAVRRLRAATERQQIDVAGCTN